MKKGNLLITLGDSWTQGIGAYNENLIATIPWIDPNQCPPEIYHGSANDFVESSWPTYISKKYNYNLINLGNGGDSLSAQVKKLYELDIKKLRNEYKQVVVICSTVIYSRLSFYNDGNISSYMNIKNDEHTDFMQHYVNEIALQYDDFIKENLFYIKTLINLLQLNDFDYYFVSLYQDDTQLFEHLNKSQVLNEKNEENNFIPLSHYIDKKNYSKCGHPNKKGYLQLAEKLYELLNRKNIFKNT